MISSHEGHDPASDERSGAGPPTDDQLVELARQAREQAYAPYSKFLVGAALLTKSGHVFAGANVENAVHGLAICAERNAIFQAVAHGEHEFEAVAVVTEPGVTPCGACRQVMREFDDGSLRVIVADTAGNHRTYLLTELLPDAFTANHLPPDTP
ncbi:MAG: cytidine deaminase [Chloroflexi bacterium]|nr:MAG: cytidine deaminase [Chloroflexota bacterium]